MRFLFLAVHQCFHAFFNLCGEAVEKLMLFLMRQRHKKLVQFVRCSADEFSLSFVHRAG